MVFVWLYLPPNCIPKNVVRTFPNLLRFKAAHGISYELRLKGVHGAWSRGDSAIAVIQTVRTLFLWFSLIPFFPYVLLNSPLISILQFSFGSMQRAYLIHRRKISKKKMSEVLLCRANRTSLFVVPKPWATPTGSCSPRCRGRSPFLP